MAMCIYLFHSNSKKRQNSENTNHKAEYNPESKKIEVWLTVITAVGVAGLLAPGLYVWNDYVTVPEEAVEVEVMAKQWGRSVQFSHIVKVLADHNEIYGA